MCIDLHIVSETKVLTTIYALLVSRNVKYSLSRYSMGMRKRRYKTNTGVDYIERFDFFVLGQDVHKIANLRFGYEPNWLMCGGGSANTHIQGYGGNACTSISR